MNVRDLVPWSRGDRERTPATRSDSLHPVMSLHREMNRLFDDVFRGFDDSRLFSARSGWPSVDVEETDKEYRVTAELPGLEERDVEVLLQDGLLTVRGEKKLEAENRNRTYSERFYGRFERQITLDRDVDDSAVSATFKSGILTVTVPKSARAVERSKRIPINTGQTEGKSH
ncbi:MAG: Hsp20/alpha crystallin family protein [Pseudomonadota bacterium]|nr:Hsp20/alpha crystallin family protein [Pseudomonadota bacterium]